MNIITRLLRKNTSPARIAGFVVSNFIGLAIVCCGLQFFLDARDIWEAEDSFIHSDYLVINKKVTSANTTGNASSDFSDAEIEDIQNQPWVRKIGLFKSVDYEVRAMLDHGGRQMSTMMFFESIPDDFIDVSKDAWHFDPQSGIVPLIIAKDYLTLYNFGFASSAGLPQLSEQLMSGLPLNLSLISNDGSRRMTFTGRVVGYSNRLNTVLVPEDFMNYTNNILGSHTTSLPSSRIIIDSSSPGDVAISQYLNDHNFEMAGDKSASQASFLLNVVSAVIICVGVVITLMSFFILLLSISLIMEKNRDKLHELLMLGYPLTEVAKPYRLIAIIASSAAFVLAVAAVAAVRTLWLEPLRGLGAGEGSILITILTALAITILVILFNILSINSKVKLSWRL